MPQSVETVFFSGGTRMDAAHDGPDSLFAADIEGRQFAGQ
jgi:hypothetical protein